MAQNLEDLCSGRWAILGVVDAEIECREPVEGILIPNLCIGLEISNQG